MNDIDDFFRTYFHWAMVAKLTTDQLQELKKYLADNGITVIYQKGSMGRLKIIEENQQ